MTYISSDSDKGDVALVDGDDRKDFLEFLGEASDRQDRLTVLLELRASADSKVNHLDNLRQANLTVAVAIAAGLFGFSLDVPDLATLVVVAVALFLLMQLFRMIDRKFHSYSQGWQATRRALTRAINTAYNKPSVAVKLLRYDHAAEEAAWYGGKLSLIYGYLSFLGPAGVLASKIWSLLPS